MTTTNNITILGHDELKRLLKNLPYQVRGRLVYNAIKKSAKPMVEEAKELAPVRKGIIQKAITIVKDAKASEPTAIIGVTHGRNVKYDAWYAHFQERGTRGFGVRTRVTTYDKRMARTAIFAGNSVSFLTVGRRRGSYIITTGYRHKGKGLPAVRFMSTAFGDKVEQTIDGIHGELSAIVQKYLRKNAPEYYAH